MTARVVALHLFCEACGAAVRVDRDDAASFCAFVGSHHMPVVDGAVLDDGRVVDVVTV